MILVTGGAGFIGSNLHAALVRRGLETVVVDRLGTRGQVAQPGQASAGAADRRPTSSTASWTAARRSRWSSTSAPSATPPRPTAIWPGPPTSSCRAASGTGAPTAAVRLVYASSAATYGDGSAGFDDDASPAALERLRPLNLYGWTKHAFDLRVAPACWRRGEPRPPQWAGLKFFNVYGPNEYHKGRMISVVKVKHDEVAAGGPARLFRSDRARARRRRAAARLHLGRRRGRRDALAAGHAGGQRAVQPRHRPGAQLPRPGPCGVRRGRRGRAGSSSSTCRTRCAGSTSRSPRRRWTGCAPPAIAGQFTPLEEGVRRYVQDYLAQADPYV